MCFLNQWVVKCCILSPPTSLLALVVSWTFNGNLVVIMDSEILWDILKFPNESQVQPALPDPV